MVIDSLNCFFRYIDYQYYYRLKKIKYFIYYVYNKIKVNIPYFLYGIKKFFYYKLYLSGLNRYKKLMYTIYKYPKYYNNFKIKDYILYNLIKDYNNIIFYYSNIVNYNR